MRIRKKFAATGVAVLLIGSILGQTVRASAFDNSGYIEGRASELQEPFYHNRKPVEFSYVYFGSYPQSEVTGEALTPAVTSAVCDEYGDVRVGNVKYRMVERDGCRRYFRYEPIRWRVIRTEKYEKEAYLLADSVLDYQCYQAESRKEDWKESDLKYCDIFMWLNSRKEGTKGFTDTAFSLQEKRDIKDYNLYVLDNGENKCITESAVVPNFYNNEYRKIYKSGECKDIQASDYAKVQSGESADSGVKWWCGRLYNNNGTIYVPYVDETGVLQEEGAPADAQDIGVCPMIIVSTADDAVWKSEREVQLEQGNIVYDEAKTAAVHAPKISDGKISFSHLYMGSYPQSEVTGEALTEEIKMAFSAASGNAVSGNAVSADAVVDGTKYRCVQEENGVHYYRFEPICWRVIYVNDKTKKALLLAEKVLDYRIYNKGGNKDERCSQLLQWLNSYGGESDSYGESADGFLNEAFPDKADSLETVRSNFWKESIKITMFGFFDSYRYLKYSSEFPMSAIGLQTAYAASKCEGEVAETPANWWMLDESYTLVFADYVDKEGGLHTDELTMGYDGRHYKTIAEDTTIGVRPTVILDLTRTDVWEPAVGEEVEYPCKNASEDEDKEDDKKDDGETEDNKDDDTDRDDRQDEDKKDEDQIPDGMQRIPGDVNGDQEVTLEDAALILKAALKIKALPEEVQAYADMNSNGRVELVDAQLVLRKALKID